MPLTSAQICSRARTIAKVQGDIAPSGLLLNVILSDLCQTYDFELARGDYVFNFSPSTTTTAAYPNNVAGSGPYDLPADYLRVDRGEFVWYLDGVPYPMINVDMAEFDMMVQTAGFQSYPAIFATDLSTMPPAGANATAVIWPPASGSYQALIRYFRQMPDIGSGTLATGWNPGVIAPESSTVIPWFPNQTYLITRLAGELMKDTSDTRWQVFLGDGDEGAQGILKRYLKMKDDYNDRAKTVSLDRRRFGRNFSTLPNTKQTGW